MDKIKIQAEVKAEAEKVWSYWNDPQHIQVWNTPSEDWHTSKAENDLRVGGTFLSRMEAKDGSYGFDFSGVYDEVEKNKVISYTLADGRRVKTEFFNENGRTKITTFFEPESENSKEMQKAGWQAILNNFKDYVENQNN